MWYNLSLDRINPCPGYLHKLGVYTESVTVPLDFRKFIALIS